MSVQTKVQSNPKLMWLLFIHRHGDRTPLNMAIGDKYNNLSYWPEGFGNLNNAGRLRMFKLGMFLRRRYESFLSDNIREVYSRSSDVERCIESSHALLAGMYPSTKRYNWNPNIPWTPAPVHTVPPWTDYLLNESTTEFRDAINNEMTLLQESDKVKNLYDESIKERELLEKELGYDFSIFHKFKCCYSTLDIELREGLQMPSWYTSELKEKLYRFAGIAFALAGGGTEKLRKMRCSKLLDDIIKRMETASIDGPKPIDDSEAYGPSEIFERKIVHYSTHDSIISAILETLDVNNPPVPPGFGATIFMELFSDIDHQGLPIGEKYIKFFYLDDTDSEKLVEKILPACQLDDKGRMTLSNFKKSVKHLLP